MFCSNCGKQIPDNTSFCNYCGAKQPTGSGVNSTVKAQQNATGTQKQKPNRKVSIIAALLVMLCAFLLGKSIFAPSTDSSDSTTTTATTLPHVATVTASPADSANPAYEAVFDDTFIIHFRPFFGLEEAHFAKKDADGIICCSDFGYEDDTVVQWVETTYIPISGYTDSQKAELDSSMRDTLADEALSCCTVEYSMGENYYTVTRTFSDLDKSENYYELYLADYAETNSLISMSRTEKNMTDDGYIKK